MPACRVVKGLRLPRTHLFSDLANTAPLPERLVLCRISHICSCLVHVPLKIESRRLSLAGTSLPVSVRTGPLIFSPVPGYGQTNEAALPKQDARQKHAHVVSALKADSECRDSLFRQWCGHPE